MKNFKKIECYKRTKDNWYPNYSGGRVRIFVVALTNKGFRVAVWGNDDCGMERDYVKESDAMKAYDFLIKQKYVNFETCEKLGFYGA